MRQFLTFVIIILLFGCSASGDHGPEKEPTTVTLSMVSDKASNPNMWGEASPVEVQVFELTDDSMFMSSDYDSLKESYKKALKNNYVKAYDYVLMPGQFKFIDAFEIDSESHYIGVVAHFIEPELSEWKKSVKVLNKGRKYHLLMQLKDYEVDLEKVE